MHNTSDILSNSSMSANDPKIDKKIDGKDVTEKSYKTKQEKNF
jgi:hypothetical protein